jgi:hypothetical protein
VAGLARALTMAPLANIGPRERRRRLLAGVAALLVGGGGLALLIALGVPRAWRVSLVVPFWFGALGLAQARGRT